MNIYISDTILSAIIGAIAAVLTMLIKDIFVKRWFDDIAAKKNELMIFRQYADPLSNATKWNGHFSLFLRRRRTQQNAA